VRTTTPIGLRPMGVSITSVFLPATEAPSIRWVGFLKSLGKNNEGPMCTYAALLHDTFASSSPCPSCSRSPDTTLPLRKSSTLNIPVEGLL